jgi:acyl carrier protein
MQQPETTTETPQAVLDGSALQQELAVAGPEDRRRLLLETVCAQTAAVLDLTSVDADSNFLEQGLTSLKALELTRGLMSLTNVEIPLVAVIEHATPAELSDYIAGALDEDGNAAGE